MKTISTICHIICGVLLFHLLGCENKITDNQIEEINNATQTDVIKLLHSTHSSNVERRISSVIALGELGKLDKLGNKSDDVIKELIALLSDVNIPVSNEEWHRSVGG